MMARGKRSLRIRKEHRVFKGAQKTFVETKSDRYNQSGHFRTISTYGLQDEVMVWLNEHCQHHWTFNNRDRMTFQDANDAFAFKMRFG